MTSRLVAGYSLIAILALTDGAVCDESYLQQAPSAEANPAFVEQLPETSVMPVSPANRRVMPQKPRRASRTQANVRLASSIFPNVGEGVTERAAPAPTDGHLPTVGSGTVSR
ncbi:MULTISPECIES: hypothetical protein [unclassified Rhizobium]|uniref:hypothetical protein n=1 Tax=unclassified Rhizobium TaxID=2613769 RepID=UPI000DDFCD6C|nr:hypothetical protein [Rhizobium sp. CNPSo 4062]MDK4705760.1 hypothetical protein [Rhizobium sp. CNPSo 4062]